MCQINQVELKQVRGSCFFQQNFRSFQMIILHQPKTKFLKIKLNSKTYCLSLKQDLLATFQLFYIIFQTNKLQLKIYDFIIISMKYYILAILLALAFAQSPLLISAAATKDKIVNPCANPDYLCLKSPGGAYYNTKTCRCEFNSVCKCMNPLHTWSNYPTCQCVCKKIAKCNDNQYWDSTTCSCQCKYHIICFNPAYVQDPRTCQCVCKPVKCKYGYYQDNSCKCVPKCKKVQTCGYNKKFNYDTCKCQ